MAEPKSVEFSKYLDLYESNASSKLVQKRERTALYGDVNKALYEWYLLAVSKNIYPDGTQLILKAKEIANRIDVHKLKGSNGWLEKWKLRYNIRQMTICRECGDVSGDTVTSWKERLPEILSGYSKADIWNLDETGYFWKALPLCLQKDLDRKLRSVKVARNLSCESQLPSLSMLRGKRKN